MIVSWNWLTDYLRLDMSADQLAERLALTGLNHESTEEVGGDLAIDLEVTSNRADCLCHLGVAREIGAVFGIPTREPNPQPPTRGTPIDGLTSVEVEDPALCPRFTARLVTGVKVGPSPWWMRKRLETLGVRPISTIVDITNYVMFECGQPLHAYDFDRLAGRKLVVRKARPGETLKAINGKTYELRPDMLAIADAERPVGLAGVMGGLDTEISATTRNVLIESAQFDPMSVRRTSRALGLFSPSSYRFERHLDPERTEWASRRCAQLVLDLAGGSLHPGLIDTAAGRPAPESKHVRLRLDQIERVLGISVSRKEVLSILSRLGLSKADGDPEAPSFIPPTWRSDLEREIDLIEEVARIHGYEAIPEDRPVPLVGSTRGPRERLETEIRAALTGLGFDEAYTFSLVSEELAQPIDRPDSTPLRVEHTSRKRENALRRSLVPALLAARSHNEAHGTPDARLFEIANVYEAPVDGALPDEAPRLALVAGLDFFALKGYLESLIERLHAAEPLHVRPIDLPWFIPGRSAQLLLGDTTLGVMGELAPQRIASLGGRQNAAAAELRLDLLLEHCVLVPQYRPLPAYPAIERDLSLVVPTDLPWSELAAAVRAEAGPTLESIRFLDTFAGAGIPEGRHSLHFGLTFRHPERTLTGQDADDAVRAVVQAAERRFGAAIRS